MGQRLSGALAAIHAQPKETPATVSHERLARAAAMRSAPHGPIPVELHDRCLFFRRVLADGNPVSQWRYSWLSFALR